MKKTLTIIALSLTGFLTFAQQDAQFSMNMFNRLSVNPAYAGTNEALCATLLYRQQWTNFPGAPKTGLLSVDYGNILHGGVGLTVDQDQLGFDKTFAAKAAYSFHYLLGNGMLCGGLDLGVMQKSLSGNFIAPDGTSTNTSNGIDPAIPWNGAKTTTYDIGFGLYYTLPNKLYVGLSSDHLPDQTMTKSGTMKNPVPPYNPKNLPWNYDYKYARHYYIMAGYTFQLGEMYDLTPSILAKSDASSTQLDINAIARWNKMVFLGASYRLSDAIVAIVGLEWQGFKFGYSYDITMSDIKKYSNGTHEIMLGYCHKFIPPVKKHGHMNERFL